MTSIPSPQLVASTSNIPSEHVTINVEGEGSANHSLTRQDSAGERRARFSASDVVDSVTQAGIPLSDDDAATLIDLLGRFSLTRPAGFLLFLPDYHFLNVTILFLVVGLLALFRIVYVYIFELILFIFHALYYRDFVRLSVMQVRPFWKTFSQFVIRCSILGIFCDHSEFINVLCFGMVKTESFFYLIYVISIANFIVMDICLFIECLLNNLEVLDKTLRMQAIKMIEYVFVCYLSLLPIIQWQRFFESMWLFIPYLSLRTVILIRLFIQTLKLMKQNLSSTHIGLNVSSNEIEDDNCAICLNTMTSGVKLPCGHIFEELCVRKWLEERNECPLCRKSVVPNFTKYDRVPLFPPYII
ncbi:unnamed protein product [Bursaphelenchus xylophilus]|uniref:(pine wood nematode) hypothetical protein n=1 Tax=Bursaphelenchus xylophilus TaxID=6326 RepID=A0A1I7SU16_BURXY|nr:unnamed protein product [Bursaphelenchus xylophilus]CAG9107688.1 unnamed protein product [Bursaphelenchus xylophilus]